jgi:hypothetical protein
MPAGQGGRRMGRAMHTCAPTQVDGADAVVMRRRGGGRLGGRFVDGRVARRGWTHVGASLVRASISRSLLPASRAGIGRGRVVWRSQRAQGLWWVVVTSRLREGGARAAISRPPCLPDGHTAGPPATRRHGGLSDPVAGPAPPGVGDPGTGVRDFRAHKRADVRAGPIARRLRSAWLSDWRWSLRRAGSAPRRWDNHANTNAEVVIAPGSTVHGGVGAGADAGCPACAILCPWALSPASGLRN